MQANFPFCAGILNIMKFNMEVDLGTIHERTSTDYELDFYISGNRDMSINGKSFSVEGGSVVFRRPGDHTVASGSYNCYTLSLDFSGKKEALYGKYDRNDPDNSLQEESTNPLLSLIPSHISVSDPSEYIKIYDQLCYNFQSIDSKSTVEILLNRLLFLVLSDSFGAVQINSENSRESRVMTETCKYVQKNFHRNISIRELAENVSFSPGYFCKLFKKAANTTPAEYIISVRFSNAKLLLSESELTISQISEMCGFSDASYFSYYFKKSFGITPGEYRLTKRKGD